MKTRVAIDITLAVTLLACFVFFAAPLSAAARIDSITPAAAARGVEVELRGSGFGATNVSVWVGGVSAQVLSATGNRVRFLVPGTAPFGSTTVEAANPGEKTASIAFTVLGGTFSVNVQPVPDTGNAFTESIGRDGGAIFTGGLTLTIPAGALSETTEITVTPLLGLNGSPLEGQVVGALFAPDGLALLKPATLSFAAPAGTTPGETLGFGFAGNGQDFHLVPHELQGGVVELEIWHFSGAGGSFGPGGGTPTWNPGTAETQALQELALAANACAQTGDPASQACSVDLPDRSRAALLRWYVDAVEPGLRAALGAPSFEVEGAYEEWLRWSAQVTRFGVNFPLLTLQNRLDEAEVLAREALANLTLRRLNNCTGTDLLSQLRDVIRMSDLAVAGVIDLTEEGLPSAFNADLMRACASVKIDPPTFPKIAARVDANELAVRTYIETYTGATIMTEPLELTLTLTNASSDASQGVPDSNGGFQTNIYPFAGVPGVIVDINVELGPNALPELTNVAQRDNLGSTERVTSFARARIELDPLPGVSTTVAAGASAPLKVRIAGNGMENASVSYSVTGVGSLSSTSGVTNQDGEAPTFDYMAPSNPSGTSATVTATLGGDQDSVTFTIRNVQVSVSPSSTTVAPGQTRQFTATVTGTPNTAVTWSATGGTIGSTGLYTAGSTPGGFGVTATSVEDPSATAVAAVQIAAGGTLNLVSSFGRVNGSANTQGTGATGSCQDTSQTFGQNAVFGSLAPFSGSGSASDPCTAITAMTADASGSYSVSALPAGATPTLDILVAAQVSASISGGTGVGELAKAGVDANGNVKFDVLGSSVPYSVQAAVNAAAPVYCMIELYGPGVLLRFRLEPGSAPLNSTGTLTPGRYMLVTDCLVGISSQGPVASTGGSLSINLHVGR